MTTGLLVRAALTDCIYKRGVQLTPKARMTLTNAALLTHVSTDVRTLNQVPASSTDMGAGCRRAASMHAHSGL